MYRKEEPHYSRRVSLENIRENGYNLNISRYVSTSQEEEIIKLEEVGRELKSISKESEKTLKLYNRFLKDLQLELI